MPFLVRPSEDIAGDEALLEYGVVEDLFGLGGG